MTVVYQPPLTGRAPFWNGELREVREVIESGPAYGRSGRASRWHMIRSGERWIADYAPDELRESWHLWCGPHMGWNSSPIFTDTPPDGEPVCGTCVGRAMGVDPGVPGVLFTPRSLQTPKKCPGSQSELYREDEGRWNRGTCLVCSEHVKLRGWGGSPYYGFRGFGPQTHPPGPALVPPCPFHAWRELRRQPDDTVVCACGGST